MERSTDEDDGGHQPSSVPLNISSDEESGSAAVVVPPPKKKQQQAITSMFHATTSSLSSASQSSKAAASSKSKSTAASKPPAKKKTSAGGKNEDEASYRSMRTFEKYEFAKFIAKFIAEIESNVQTLSTLSTFIQRFCVFRRYCGVKEALKITAQKNNAFSTLLRRRSSVAVVASFGVILNIR